MQINRALVILGNLNMPGQRHLEWLYHYKKTSTFITRQKINFILHDFLEILQKYCKLVVLSTLGMSGGAHSKWYYRLAENLWLSAGKNSTSSLMLFWRYCEDMQIYVGYFEYTWLHSSKIIVPNCRRLQLLFACKT